MFTSSAFAETITYSELDYNSIQAAINSLSSNDDSENMLILPRGSYDGNMIISDNLILRGEETAACFLTNSSNTNSIITISGNIFVEIYNLTFSACNTAIQLNELSSGNINNNVFSLGSSNIAISLGNSTSANIFNNTFHDNEFAIDIDDEVTGVTNNIFSASGTNSIIGLSDNTVVSFNFFISEPDSTVYGSNVLTASSNDFVSSLNLDFHHNSSSSMVVNAGVNIIGFDAIDDSPVDLGVYGGNLSDVIPLAIPDLVLSSDNNAIIDFDVSLFWDDNTDYRVKGYFIYYDTDSGTSPYEGNLSNFDISPIVVEADVTSFNFNDMDLTYSLSAPKDVDAEALSGALDVVWSTVTGADNYTVEYRETGSANFTLLGPVETNSTSISGLTDGVSYEVRVQAHVLPTIYYAVAAYYDRNVNLGKISDISSSTNSISANTIVSSAYSATEVFTPNITVPFPTLPNNGGGCLLKRLK